MTRKDPTVPYVFAAETVALPIPGGGQVVVRKGEHWWADDPVVKGHPVLFTDDPRYGLSYTTPPPEMALPPGEEIPATQQEESAASGERGGRRRSKSEDESG